MTTKLAGRTKVALQGKRAVSRRPATRTRPFHYASIRPERGVAVADVYVRSDGARLAELVAVLADETLSLHVAATLPLAEAATALRDAVTGRSKGANVLTPDRS